MYYHLNKCNYLDQDLVFNIQGNIKYHIVDRIKKCNLKIVERKSIHLTHLYMTSHFHGMAQTGLN